MTEKKIMVTRSSMPPLEEYVELLEEIWESRCLTNRGPLHEAFAEQLKEYLGCDHVGLFANGHLALELALNTLPKRDGGEIITTAYSFSSTVHAIVRSGYTPVFCDIKEDDFTINPRLIESLITERTVAIVATHVYGFLCDDEAISEIAKRHGLTVIYDAAHAFGVFHKGISAANFGDAAMFSAHATKVFHTIEGGILCCREKSRSDLAVVLSNFGLVEENDVRYVGTNAKMNEMEAAMGICNLRHLNEELGKRKLVAERYMERLRGVKGLTLPTVPDDTQWNYAYFPVLFDGKCGTRDEVMERLLAKGIVPRKYFAPALHKATCYRGQYGHLSLPITERVAEQVLALPIYADLDLEDVDRICDIILNEGGNYR